MHQEFKEIGKFKAIRMQCFSPNTTLPHQRKEKVANSLNSVNAQEKVTPDNRTQTDFSKNPKFKLETQSINSNIEGYSLMDQTQQSRLSPTVLASVFNKQRSKYQNNDLNLSKGTLKNPKDKINLIQVGSLNVGSPLHSNEKQEEGDEQVKKSRVIYSKNGQIRYQKDATERGGRDSNRSTGLKNYERPTINSNVRYDKINIKKIQDTEKDSQSSQPSSPARFLPKGPLGKSPQGKKTYLQTFMVSGAQQSTDRRYSDNIHTKLMSRGQDPNESLEGVDYLEKQQTLLMNNESNQVQNIQSINSKSLSGTRPSVDQTNNQEERATTLAVQIQSKHYHDQYQDINPTYNNQQIESGRYNYESFSPEIKPSRNTQKLGGSSFSPTDKGSSRMKTKSPANRYLIAGSITGHSVNLPQNPLSNSSLEVDYTNVNQTNIFDQSRISYLNREMNKGPKLEENLQITKLEFRKPQQEPLPVSTLNDVNKSNQTKDSNESDQENPLLSRSDSKDSVNKQAGSPEMVTTHRMQNDDSIRKSRFTPVVAVDTRNQTSVRTSALKTQKGHNTIRKGSGAEGDGGLIPGALPQFMANTGKFNPSTFDDSLEEDVRSFRVGINQKSANVHSKLIVNSKLSIDQNKSKEVSEAQSQNLQMLGTQSQEFEQDEEGTGMRPMQARAALPFENKNENNILVTGLVSGDQVYHQEYGTHKDQTLQNSGVTGSRIAVMNKRGLSNRNLKNISVSSYQHDKFPQNQNQNQDRESMFDPENTGGEKFLENKMSNLDSVFGQQNSLNNTTTQGNSSPELIKKNLQVEQIRLKSKKMDQESIVEEIGDYLAYKSQRNDQEIQTQTSLSSQAIIFRRARGHQVQSRQNQTQIGKTVKLSKNFIKEKIQIDSMVKRAAINKKQGFKKEGIFGQSIVRPSGDYNLLIQIKDSRERLNSQDINRVESTHLSDLNPGSNPRLNSQGGTTYATVARPDVTNIMAKNRANIRIPHDKFRQNPSILLGERTIPQSPGQNNSKTKSRRGDGIEGEMVQRAIHTRGSYTKESNNTAVTGVARMQTGSSLDPQRYNIDQIGVSPTNELQQILQYPIQTSSAMKDSATQAGTQEQSKQRTLSSHSKSRNKTQDGYPSLLQGETQQQPPGLETGGESLRSINIKQQRYDVEKAEESQPHLHKGAIKIMSRGSKRNPQASSIGSRQAKEIISHLSENDDNQSGTLEALYDLGIIQKYKQNFTIDHEQILANRITFNQDVEQLEDLSIFESNLNQSLFQALSGQASAALRSSRTKPIRNSNTIDSEGKKLGKQAVLAAFKKGNHNFDLQALPHLKNQFIPYKDRSIRNDIKRFQNTSSLRNNANQNIEMVSNKELIEALVQSLPSFGLFSHRQRSRVQSNQQSKRTSRAYMTTRRESAPLIQSPKQSDQTQNQIIFDEFTLLNEQISRINSTIFAYKQSGLQETENGNFMKNLSKDIDSLDLSKLPNIKDLLIQTLNSSKGKEKTKPKSTALELDLETIMGQTSVEGPKTRSNKKNAVDGTLAVSQVSEKSDEDKSEYKQNTSESPQPKKLRDKKQEFQGPGQDLKHMVRQSGKPQKAAMQKNVNLAISTEIGHVTASDLNTPLQGRIKNPQELTSSKQEVMQSAENSHIHLKAIKNHQEDFSLKFEQGPQKQSNASIDSNTLLRESARMSPRDGEYDSKMRQVDVPTAVFPDTTRNEIKEVTQTKETSRSNVYSKYPQQREGLHRSKQQSPRDENEDKGKKIEAFETCHATTQMLTSLNGTEQRAQSPQIQKGEVSPGVKMISTAVGIQASTPTDENAAFTIKKGIQFTLNNIGDTFVDCQKVQSLEPNSPNDYLINKTSQSLHLDSLIQSSFDRKVVKEIILSERSRHDQQKLQESPRFIIVKQNNRLMDLPPESRALILQYYRYKAINETYKQVLQFKQKEEQFEDALSQNNRDQSTLEKPQRDAIKKNQRYKMLEKNLQTSLNLRPPQVTTEEPFVASEPSVKMTEGVELNLKPITPNSHFSHSSQKPKVNQMAQMKEQFKRILSRDIAKREYAMDKLLSVLYKDANRNQATYMNQTLLQSLQEKKRGSVTSMDRYDKEVQSITSGRARSSLSEVKGLLSVKEARRASMGSLGSQSGIPSLQLPRNMQNKKDATMQHFQTSGFDEPMLFQNKFRAYRPYQPTPGTLKTDGLRKTETNEILNIVQNYSVSKFPTGLKQKRKDQLSETQPRSFQPPYVSKRQYAKEIPPLNQGSLHCQLPELQVHNQFGEDILSPYFPHRIKNAQIEQILQNQQTHKISQFIQNKCV